MPLTKEALKVIFSLKIRCRQFPQLPGKFSLKISAILFSHFIILTFSLICDKVFRLQQFRTKYQQGN